MSREIARKQWAAIVYGRSYHLDFRFITIPEDFQQSDTAWAAEHILATTRQARNLTDLPRWSLFKNDRYCIIGVTCMVRDLIGQLGKDGMEIMAKDDLGRPLYVFVGYVTQLDQHKSLLNFPAYTGQHLAAFKPLYRELEKIWLIKDYQENSRHAALSPYQALNSSIELISTEANVNQLIKLNNQRKRPKQLFLWSNTRARNCQLWIAAAKCSTATSLCLDIKGKHLVESPFLNQSTTQTAEFTICDRLIPQSSPRTKDIQPKSFLPQKISQRAKADLDLTLTQAAKVAGLGQELVNHFGDRPAPPSTASKIDDLQSDRDSQSAAEDSFGFKTKTKAKQSKPLPENQDWF